MEKVLPVETRRWNRRSMKEITRIAYSAEEVAKMLGITREHVYALMDKGLPTLKLGRTRRILSDDLDTWLKEQKEIRNSR